MSASTSAGDAPTDPAPHIGERPASGRRPNHGTPTVSLPDALTKTPRDALIIERSSRA